LLQKRGTYDIGNGSQLLLIQAGKPESIVLSDVSLLYESIHYL